MAMDVIKKRWLQIKEEGGFQGLENGFRGEIARREWPFVLILFGEYIN